MNGFLQLLLLLSVTFRYSEETCVDNPLSPDNWKYQSGDYSSCIYRDVQNEAIRHDTDIKPAEFRIEVKNETNGEIQVHFPTVYNAANNAVYEVSLYIDEKKNTTEECKNFIGYRISCYDRLFHSIKNFSTSTCKGAANSQQSYNVNASVTFTNVYTGCYLAIVASTLNSCTYPCRSFSESYFIKTAYEKDPVWKNYPAIGEQPHPSTTGSGTQDVSIIISNFIVLFHERLIVDFYLWNESTCEPNTAEIGNHIAKWTLHPPNENKLDCENSSRFSNFRGCKLDQNNDDTVACKLENMKPGNYCVKLNASSSSEQCSPSVWTFDGHEYFSSCFYHHTFAVNIESSDDHVENMGNDGTIVTLVIIMAISLFIIAGIYFAFYFNPDRTPKEITEVLLIPLGTPQNCKVLLLYAQDCKEFMHLMSVFRELLQEVKNVEVLDCFDYNRRDVEMNGSAWMQYWASNAFVKVVVVISPCAVAHQQAISKSITLGYRDPMQYNDLFRLGLQEVMHNQQRNYRNTFIVKFDDLDLDHVLPYTRYILPLGVNDLLQDMNLYTDQEQMKTTISFMVHKLKTEHEKLLEHYQKQPDYVNQLMYRLNEGS